MKIIKTSIQVNRLSRECLTDLERLRSRESYGIVYTKFGEINEKKFYSVDDFKEMLKVEKLSEEILEASSILVFDNAGLKVFVMKESEALEELEDND